MPTGTGCPFTTSAIFTSVCGIGVPSVPVRISGGSSSRVKEMIGEHSVVPNMIEKRDPEPALPLPSELGGHRGPARADDAQARQVAGGELGVVEHRDQHRGHAAAVRRPLGLDQRELQAGVELGEQHQGGADARRAEHAEAAARGVEQRHRPDEHVTRP